MTIYCCWRTCTYYSGKGDALSQPLKVPYVSLWAKHHRWWQKRGPCALEWLSTGGQEISAGGRKGGPCVLLGGRQIPAAPTENSVESLRKMKTRTTTWSSSPPSGYVAKGNENRILDRYLHFPVYCSIITVAKIWKQPMEVTFNRWMDQGHLCIQWNIIQLWGRRKSCHFPQQNEPEGIMLSVISQIKIDTYYITYMWKLKKTV